MNYILDFLHVQKVSIINTFKNFRYIFIVAASIIAGSLAISVVSNVLTTLFGGSFLSILLGIIIYLLEMFILSFIMNVLTISVKQNANGISIIRDDNGQFVYKLVQIGFIFYIIKLLLNFAGLSSISQYIYLIIIVIFNALPESIYLEEYDGMSTIVHSVQFLGKNIINWGIPNLIILFLFKVLNISYIFPFNIYFSRDIVSIGITLLTVLLYSVVLIYRGNLFQVLNGSSMRKREYMRKFN